MDIGVRRRKSGTLFLATLALVFLGLSLVAAIWLNLREQRSLVDGYVLLSARSMVRGVQATLARGLHRFGREGPDIFLPMVEGFFNDLVQSGEVAALGLYGPDGRSIVYVGPKDDGRPFELPPAIPGLIGKERDREWSGVVGMGDQPIFVLVVPTRKGIGPMGRRKPPPPPPHEALVMVGLDMKNYYGPYRDMRRAAVLQTIYVLVVGAFFWALLWAYMNRREQGRKLLHLESFQSKLLDAMPDGLVTVGGDGRITAASAAARRILARIPDFDDAELIGRPFAELPFSAEQDDVEPTWRQIELKSLFLESLSVPLDAPDEHAARLVLLRDRTKLRSLEKDLNQAKELAAIGRLAAGVAHEIRNPLSSLRGFAQFFKTKLKGREPEETYADTMVHEADRLNRVVTDLLFLARPKTLDLARTDLAQTVEELTQLLRFDLKEKSLALTADLRTTTVTADADALKQALLNLTLNSLAAVRPETGVVSISSERDNGAVRVSVEDNGCGMTEEERQNALEPFFTTKKQGSGLGLAIVHKIMREHHGRIEISSTSQKGTRVSLLFPSPTPPPSPTTETAKPQKKGLEDS